MAERVCLEKSSGIKSVSFFSPTDTGRPALVHIKYIHTKKISCRMYHVMKVDHYPFE